MIAKIAVFLGLVAIVWLWWRRRKVEAAAMRPAEARAKNLHVVASHGRRDPILPSQSGEDLSKLLGENGAEVKFIPHAGAHEIPPAALQGLADLASRRLR